MKKTKTLVASLIAIVMCFTMIIGTTFAWFTDSITNTNSIIKSGNVDVELWHCDFNASLPWGFGYVEENGKQVDESTKLFLNVEGKDILWEPGAGVGETFRIKNVGSLAFKYEFRVKVLDKTTTLDSKSLTDVVKLQAVELEYLENNIPVGAGLDDENVNIANDYVIASELLSGEYVDYYISLDWFSTENDNDYANLKMNVGIELVATQLTYENDGSDSNYDKNAQFPEITYPDTLNGEPDIFWFLENPTATEYTLTSAEEFAGLQQLVDGTAAITYDVASEITFPVTFEGQTIKLDTDVNLYQEDENGNRISFDPIGSYVEKKYFQGTFDGQGHTISNVYQNGWALENGYWDGDDYGMGLFAAIENAHIKNLTLDGSSMPTEANIIGAVAGVAGGTCTYENITVKNAYLGNHSWYSGGLIGWAEGNQTFINCNVDESVSISSQWGDFNNANGGLIGGIDPAGTYHFEDCNVACVIDTYNDVTSAYEWYSYRNCGMLIGDTGEKDDNNMAIASNVTCKNVTVTYGDWANYHYCEFSSADYPFCRVEAGDSTGAYGNARVGGKYLDAKGNEVVDDNHVHNDGEKHNELIVFDQLFGGASGDRYVTYGNPSHEGVTVIYNNK